MDEATRRQERDRKKNGKDSQSKLRGNIPQVYPDHFGTPSENAGDIRQSQVTPKNGTDSSTFFQKSKVLDDAHSKIKIPIMGICQPHKRVGVNLWEEKTPRPPTPRRAALKSKRKICRPSKDVSTGENKLTIAWLRMNLIGS